ncbi:MAG: hypothetical protein JJ864_01800 [Rhizobiaceae bacterium]|nr:hypothetical protein [Rhizobiaceae bacterium]
MERSVDANPFSGINEDHAALWNVLVHDDIEAFIACDWERHAADILPSAFFGIHANGARNPEAWSPAFSTLDQYKGNWLGFATRSAARADRETLRQAHFAASSLRRIEINGDLALCLKHFDGEVRYANGETERLDWETAYMCRKLSDKWYIAAFVGFLPAS